MDEYLKQNPPTKQEIIACFTLFGIVPNKRTIIKRFGRLNSYNHQLIDYQKKLRILLYQQSIIKNNHIKFVDREITL